jgi:hypothetical protein
MEITLVNLILAVLILAVGMWAYGKRKSRAALLVGIAFGLFAVSHLLTLLGLAGTLNSLLIAVRILGYLVALYAVHTMGLHK